MLDNSDSEVVFFQNSYAERIKKIADQLPNIKAYIQVGGKELLDLENCYMYEEIISQNPPLERKTRSEDNIYMLYTGGTTGMPKGVMYKQGAFMSSLLKTAFAMGFDVPESHLDISKTVTELSSKGTLSKTIVACPLMHGTGMWLGAFLPLLLGGAAITTSNLGFDPDQLWAQVQNKKATNIVIVGDAFAKPMLDALNRGVSDGNAYDISSVQVIISSGVMWSAEVKQGLLEHHNMKLMDTMGSTEGGMGASAGTTLTEAAASAL